jgi:hypothetical protein
MTDTDPIERIKHRRAAVTIALAAIYGSIGGMWQSFTVQATIWIGLGCLAIFLLSVSPRAKPVVLHRSDALFAWTAWLAAVGGWELFAFLGHPRSTHPTISSIGDDLISTHPARALAIAGWFWTGFWLARK